MRQWWQKFNKGFIGWFASPFRRKIADVETTQYFKRRGLRRIYYTKHNDRWNLVYEYAGSEMLDYIGQLHPYISHRWQEYVTPLYFQKTHIRQLYNLTLNVPPPWRFMAESAYGKPVAYLVHGEIKDLCYPVGFVDLSKAHELHKMLNGLERQPPIADIQLDAYGSML